MRILMMLKEHYCTMYSLLLEAKPFEQHLQDMRVEFMPAETISDVQQVMNVINSGYDVLILPLTLGRGLSLLLAQIVHALKSPTRLLLVSGTNAPREVIIRLYDEFMSDQLNPAELIAAAREITAKPLRRIANVEDQEAAIEAVLNSASCFRNTHHATAPSWATLAAGWKTKIEVLEGRRSRLPILFCAADPSEEGKLCLGREHRLIHEQLRLSNTPHYALVARFATRPKDFSRAIHEVQPSIVHFSGHGTVHGIRVAPHLDDRSKVLTGVPNARSGICGSTCASRVQNRLAHFGRLWRDRQCLHDP